MKKLFPALLSGLLMGAGLVISGMTDPAKVLGFLNITGQWDPTLMMVMGGAILINLPLTLLILKRTSPVAENRFHLPTSNSIDKPLIVGAALFGIGWGLAGICPGPAIASLVTGGSQILVFVAAMVAGFWIQQRLTAR